MKVLLVPIDDRPVTYVYPQLIAKQAGFDVLVPPREIFGSLAKPTDRNLLSEFLTDGVKKQKVEALVISLDSLIYGGLVNSRRSDDDIDSLAVRLGLIRDLKRATNNKLLVYAHSSIMRISDNNDAAEEKYYWSDYGRELFAWSALLHKLSLGKDVSEETLKQQEAKIPKEIRDDYLQTRRRNHQMNMMLTDVLNQGWIDRLVWSQDDSGEYGLNVLEKELIQQTLNFLSLEGRAACYPGADEVLSTLVARMAADSQSRKAKIYVQYSVPETADCLSRYEGQAIGKTIDAQISACGAIKVDELSKADFLLVVHGHSKLQGDHIWLEGQPDLRQLNTEQAVERTIYEIANSRIPCVLCDVAYANGADPILIDRLLGEPAAMRNIIAFGGWNTTGNRVGGALATAVTAFVSGSSTVDLRPLLFIRLADDWAYQSIVREKLKKQNGSQSGNEKLLDEMMAPYIQKLSDCLDYHPASLKLSFPWQRSFEVEVAIT